jgi:hypothetical protein
MEQTVLRVTDRYRLTTTEQEQDMEANIYIYSEALNYTDTSDWLYAALSSLDRLEAFMRFKQPDSLCTKEKVELRKYMFDMTIVPKNAEVTSDERCLAFAAYLRSPDDFEKKHRSLLYEYNLQHTVSIKNGYLDNPTLRAEQIHKLTVLLGLSLGTQHVGQTVERAALLKVLEEYSVDERNRVLKLFNSRPCRNKTDSETKQNVLVARAAYFVNKILYAHGYTCISQGGVKEVRLRKGGVHLNVTPFVVNVGTLDRLENSREVSSVLHRGFLAYLQQAAGSPPQHEPCLMNQSFSDRSACERSMCA